LDTEGPIGFSSQRSIKKVQRIEGAIAMKRLKTSSVIILLSLLLASLGMNTDKSAGPPDFKAALLGNEEVPPVETKAKGEAKFEFHEGRDELAYSVVLKNIADVTAAHIHKGKKGGNGPPVVDLFREPRKKDVTGTLFSEGTIAAYQLMGPLEGKPFQSLIQMIRAGDAYVNVHTKKHPEGEIRGQIMPGMKQGSQAK
jgi:hypothetical protein